MIEIERKFLIRDHSFEKEAISKRLIKQGFLSTDPERTVRIRVEETKGFLTVKGISNDGGLSRFEWETPLTKQEADALFLLCLPGAIEKTRYVVPLKGLYWEIDVFYGDNQGLVLAEVELANPSQVFEKPSWVGAEVTGQKKYYNASLSRRPFKEWQ